MRTTKYQKPCKTQPKSWLDKLSNVNIAKCVDVSKEKNGKVYKEILKVGEGGKLSVPTDGCEIVVHNIGMTADGTVLGDSKTGQRFTFRVGIDDGKFMRGLEQGIMSMRRGELAKLYIHPDYCDYGLPGKTIYPKNGKDAPPLICKLGILDIKPEDLTACKSGTLLRRKIKVGENRDEHPKEGDTVQIALRAEYKGAMFDQRTVSFVLGNGCRVNIPYGIEKALLKFSKREFSHVTLALGPELGFGSEGHPNFKVPIPPNATVMYLIELQDIKRVPVTFASNQPDKCAVARKMKDWGHARFQYKKYFGAAYVYKVIIDILRTEMALHPDNLEAEQLLRDACLNKAICHLVLYEPVVAKQYAEMALKMNQNIPKTQYIHGLCNIGITDGFAAKTNFLMAKRLERNYMRDMLTNRILLCDKLIREEWEPIKEESEETNASLQREKYNKLDMAKQQKLLIDTLKSDEDFFNLLS